jgi:uncharacterized protein (TIRG00374 family)
MKIPAVKSNESKPDHIRFARRFSPKHLLKLIGVGCLFYLFYSFDIKKIVTLWTAISGKVLFVVISLTIVQIVLKFLRWHVLIRMLEKAIPFFDGLFIYLSGLFWGIASPGRLGEFYKCRQLNHFAGIAYKDGFFTIIIDRLFDLIGIVLVGLLCMVFIPGLQAWAVFATSLGLVVGALFFRQGIKVLLNYLQSFLNRVGQRELISQSITPWKERLCSRTGLIATGITLIGSLVIIIQAWVLARHGFNMPMTPIEAGFVICLFSLSSAIPVSYMGFGINEVMLLAVTQQWLSQAYQSEVVIAFSLSLNTLLILPSLLVSGSAIIIMQCFKLVSSTSRRKDVL